LPQIFITKTGREEKKETKTNKKREMDKMHVLSKYIRTNEFLIFFFNF